MAFTDFNPDMTVDDRAPMEQARATVLREIAWAFGLPCAGTATKAEVLPLLQANGIVLNQETINKAIENRNARLKAHFDAVQKGQKPKQNEKAVKGKEQPDILNMKWFELVALAKEHGIDADEAAPKGTDKRAEMLRKAIMEKLSG